MELEEILSDLHSEHDLVEVRLNKKPLGVLIAAAVIISAIAIFQLVNLGIGQNEFYRKSALANVYRNDVEPAPRGLILDRFGRVIVQNESVFRVLLAPDKFPSDPGEKQKILAKISQLVNISLPDLAAMIKKHDWRLGRLVLRDSLTHDELVNIQAAQLPVLVVQPVYRRKFLDNQAFSHIVGYTGAANLNDLAANPDLTAESILGKDGLEKYYDAKLRGKDGKIAALKDAKGKVINKTVVVPPRPGEDLPTFLDAELQVVFYNALASQIKNLKIKGGGAGIVINPQNGEVLSLVSYPSFDPNNIAQYLNKPYSPLFNRIVGGLYNPGSTIKPLVATAVLKEGVVTPDKTFFSPGYLKVENPYNPERPYIYKDWRPQGWVNLRSALAKSSNVYFYIVGGGYKSQPGLGIARLNQWWRKFNLDQPTQIDLPGENTGLLPTPAWKKKTTGDIWRVGDTYNVAIGQGNLKITLLELADYLAAIANGGKIMKLRVAKTGEPEVINDLSQEVSADIFKEVQKGMRDAVVKKYGTAHLLADLPISVAAKTGSAQVGRGKTNAFFAGYAPVDNPQLLILVLIENAREGSLNAVPVAREVFLWYYENRLKAKINN